MDKGKSLRSINPQPQFAHSIVMTVLSSTSLLLSTVRALQALSLLPSLSSSCSTRCCYFVIYIWLLLQCIKKKACSQNKNVSANRDILSAFLLLHPCKRQLKRSLMAAHLQLNLPRGDSLPLRSASLTALQLVRRSVLGG